MSSLGNSLAIQCLGLCAFTVRALAAKINICIFSPHALPHVPSPSMDILHVLVVSGHGPCLLPRIGTALPSPKAPIASQQGGLPPTAHVRPVCGLSHQGSFHRFPFEFSSIGRIRILAELGLGEIKTSGFEDLFYHQRPPKCPIKASLTLFLITCINWTKSVLYPSGNRNAAATTIEPGHQPPSPGWEHLKGRDPVLPS